MRLRTVKQFWREMREADPNNAMGLSALKAAVNDGVITSYQVGRRRLVDADRALESLFAGREQPPKAGEVRRIDP